MILLSEGPPEIIRMRRMYLRLLVLVAYIQYMEGQNVVFEPSPENSTVVEGGTARFTCVPKVNGVQGLAAWSVQPIGVDAVTPRTDNNTNLSGASGVYQSPDRTQLIITGVENSLHLTSVECRGTNADATIIAVPADVVYILVQRPPTPPRGLRIVDLQPFSAQVTWSPPKDNGGVEPVRYRGTVSNGTVLDFNTTNITMVTLTHLQHSTDYSVSLLAENIHGTSPPVEVVFRTPDSAPIIDVVRPKPLSLASITVTITLLTTGGRDVTGFNIVVDGTSAMDCTSVADGKLAEVTIVVTSLNLTEGTDYEVSVTATNSIGTSEPVTGTLSVPTPLTSSNAPVTSLETIVIILAVIIAVLVFLLVILTVYSILVTIKLRRVLGTIPKGAKTSELVYDEMEMKPPSGQSDHEVTMEKNPAYEAVNVGTTTEHEEVGGGRRE